VSFAERVYAVVSCIPEGKVSTYGAVARALDCRAYQAVGVVLSKNPCAPVVPCHRVVRSDRSLGGFMGSLGDEVLKKRALLEGEGVVFEGDGRVSSCCVITLSS